MGSASNDTVVVDRVVARTPLRNTRYVIAPTPSTDGDHDSTGWPSGCSVTATSAGTVGFTPAMFTTIGAVFTLRMPLVAMACTWKWMSRPTGWVPKVAVTSPTLPMIETAAGTSTPLR